MPIMVPPNVNAVAPAAPINFPFPPKNRAAPASLPNPFNFFAAKSFAIAAVSFIAPVIKVLLRPKINLPKPVPNTRYKDKSFFQCLPKKFIYFVIFFDYLV